ncbi:MAG: M48 family metallopeptidase [Oscillospiraceae bacterium]
MKTIKLPDGREISYELTRKRVKNINFRAREDGIVAVSANSRVTVKQIEDFLIERADFFFKAFEKLQKRACENNTNSRLVRYLGRDFPVRVIENSREIAVIDENECRVFTKSTDEDYIAALREKAVLTRFAALCRELDAEVRERLREKGFELPPTRISIKDMKSRWGSCSYTRGHISINSRLAAYPRDTILSVFYHEYAHFWHHDHSQNFYRFLLAIYPDYYVHNNVLKQH